MPVMSVSWNASEPSSAAGTWPVMQTIGIESIIAVAMPVTRLVAPGPGGGDRHADPAAGARVAVGHVRGALFVADQHVANRVIEQRVVGRQDGAAGVAEDGVDALFDQARPDDVSSALFHKVSS